MLVVVASPLVAVMTVVALVAAVRRRLPSSILPFCFAALALAMSLVIRASVAGPHWALAVDGVGVTCAWAALGFSAVTIDSQLHPLWWRRFERDLDAWRSSSGDSERAAA